MADHRSNRKAFLLNIYRLGKGTNAQMVDLSNLKQECAEHYKSEDVFNEDLKSIESNQTEHTYGKDSFPSKD